MKIVIVDDDKLVAVSLKTIISGAENIEVCAIGSSADEAVELYRKHKPDIMLMDIRMGEKTGLEAAEIILSEDNNAKILFLTTFADEEYIFKALKIGAKGYILKQNYESIVPSLVAVEHGHNVYGEEKSAEEFGINEKEKEIIDLVSKGLSNKEIASEMYLSEGTVRNYLSVILDKLNLRDRTQLVIFYFNYLN